jgi:uncharacterized YigZ family protein
MGKRVIANSIIHEIVVEKSRFIAYVQPIKGDNDFNGFKAFVKKDSPNARHYPYAFVLENSARSSDDGEPSGTAGRPLLELLNNLNLTDVAVIVVRYFGGVKLGAGRLLRTYVEAAKQALDKLPKLQQIDSVIYEINIRSSLYPKVEGQFNAQRIEILERSFLGETVTLKVNVPVSLDLKSAFNLEGQKLATSKIYQKEE